MQEKNNAVCSICGSPYYMCLACKDAMKLSPWKKHTDTSEHYKIYQIIHGYSTGVYTKNEAKSKLQMVDLSDFDNLRDNIKNVIKDIMGENEKVEDIAIEAKPTVVLSNEIDMSDKDDSMSEMLKVTRKRKSYKVVETE